MRQRFLQRFLILVRERGLVDGAVEFALQELPELGVDVGWIINRL